MNFLVSTITSPGSLTKLNEDTFVCHESRRHLAAAVIDGATGLAPDFIGDYSRWHSPVPANTPAPTDPAWFAGELAAAYQHFSDPDSAFQEVIHQSVQATALRFQPYAIIHGVDLKTQAYRWPQAAGAFVHISPAGWIDLAFLADCSVVLQNPGEDAVFLTNSGIFGNHSAILEHRDWRRQQALKPVNDCLLTNGNGELIQREQALRAKMNTSEGPSVWRPNRECLDFVHYYHNARLKPGGKLLLMSDGFERLLNFKSPDGKSFYTPNSLMDCISQNGLQYQISSLRRVEQTGYFTGKPPSDEIKRSDDATAVFIVYKPPAIG